MERNPLCISFLSFFVSVCAYGIHPHGIYVWYIQDTAQPPPTTQVDHMMGPFLACPPSDVPFTPVRNVPTHVFTSHHNPAAHWGRQQPACFVVHKQMLRPLLGGLHHQCESAVVLLLGVAGNIVLDPISTC